MKTRSGLFVLVNVFFILIPAMGLTALAGEGPGLEAQVKALIEQNRRLEEQNRRLSSRLNVLETDMAGMKEGTTLKGESESQEEEMTAAGKKWYERFSMDMGITGVLQATANNGNNNPEGGNHADGAYTMDMNLEADLEDYGNFFIHLEGGDGEGINNNVPSFSVPNYDSYATLKLDNQAALTISEAFYENSFFNDRFIFDLGKMDISVLFDENEAAGDETTQYLSNIFVKSMGLTIPEPDEFYCPATMLTLAPMELLEFRIVAASVDNDDEHTWENIFSDGFIATQMNIKPRLLEREGNYRFYGWYDSRRHLDNDRLADANKNPVPEDGRADSGQTGWGLSFDQEVADGFTAFARYSWTQDDLSIYDPDAGEWSMIPFNQVYSIGMTVAGTLWSRPEDGVGFAFGQTLLTDDYEDANPHTANEKYIETWYRYVFNRFVALSADFQWTENPGGSSEADDVYIFGVRSQINF